MRYLKFFNTLLLVLVIFMFHSFPSLLFAGSRNFGHATTETNDEHAGIKGLGVGVDVDKRENTETCMGATLLSDLTLHIPFLNYTTTTDEKLSFNVTFEFVPDGNQIFFELMDLRVNDSPSELCAKAFLSSDLSLYISSIDYHATAGEFKLWAKLEYVTDTYKILFKLVDAGQLTAIPIEEITKFTMWTGETKLRGANIWQSRNYVEIHGEGTLGSGAVGPPFTQADFDNLSASGANYVNISHPGLYTENPPYMLDKEIQDNIDNLLGMIARADMFAVITFRTGPGRSEFWAVFGEDTTTDPEEGWFDSSYYNHRVWTDQAAQDGWVEMWRYAAERYKDNPVVVGYDLMCEPNPGDMLLEISNPDEFYPTYADTLYDWNRFYPGIVNAIREKDTDTPILVQPMGYGSVAWLPYLETTNDTKTVYTVHQYEPFIYTHQTASSSEYAYPGTFDANGDGNDDQVDKTWLQNLLATMDKFSSDHNVRVAVNEFGLHRWDKGADKFMDDMMDLLDQRGVNHTFWEWASSWEPFAWNDAFNFRFGADPANQRDVTTSDLIEVIRKNWSKNTLRPSYVTFSGTVQLRDIKLKSSITSVQPMTGIVFWPDNDRIDTDAIQLEFSYVLYNQVVKDSGVYDWTSIDNLLDEVSARKHQAILRFRFVYPGFETSVPGYIKNLSEYHETKSISEGLDTWFPDWTNSELQRFVLEFYTKFGEKYQNDPRLAFLQTGFGLWAEYHIYDGPFELGTTFPSKEFQESFFNHLDVALKNIPWSVSIDAANETYSPLSRNTNLLNIHFGLFDDSFMHEKHSAYNETSWKFFGSKRYLTSPAGGEFSYYSDFDQRNVLNTEGVYGVTYEKAADQFHISYMIGNDQPSYQTMERIKEAGLARGYKFEVVSFKASKDTSVVEIKNNGVAPFYYDAYASVNGIRSKESLRFLPPGKSVVCHISSGGVDPVLTIESDHLIKGQKIEYMADLSD